ncbi:M48 family metallopeptidase [Pacificoceanicola onchidii]|uniref:M48 family metallopeptidase n=1 Tax=Pacificoceanicola onchidii TaxID=2562685 RepID=UPI0010A60CDA|nr:SprT family zinc-dependent metalloprotease [Pacificoceanicola onchidii]
MGQIRLSGNPPISVTVRRSARAKKLSLRLSRLDGRVTLTLPKGVSEQEGRDFVLSKEDWLRGHLDKHEAAAIVSLGQSLPIHGRNVALVPGSGRSVKRSGDTLMIPGAEAQVPRRVQAFLKTLARDRLAEASDRYAARLGRPYNRLTLRDTRSRWGSCTADGGLMYSWRLIMAPPEVLDYVAAHEVAHLQEMNHSAAFWAVVEQLYGDWRGPRRWLRENGPALHRYRFD